ncbi:MULTISPECIES: hypothetical protein [unclassified Clostridium]|uniref:hypothetical protein n=1 Tax=unclassified Clostridium TaxID=2614128 RepID=UPI0013E94E24|nr:MULTISPECIES: hypothetical protein [unclassified Clostridium]MBZ9626093.1 hypothetical protein [Clostridium sp. FP2]MBZ9637685.1 hypothetical protein [Clostridium sp. FP1]
MKNKLVKLLSTGICCIMVSLLISTYIPQNSTVALGSNSIAKSSGTILIDDPPFH